MTDIIGTVQTIEIHGEVNGVGAAQLLTQQASSANDAAQNAAATALAATRYFATRAAGEAASATGQLFSTDDSAGSVVYYRRTSGGSVVIGGAVTPASLAAIPAEQFGAIGDGATDDTVALQAALDSGRSVRLRQGKTYLLRSKLTISTSGMALTGGGAIKIAADFAKDSDAGGTHMRAIFVTAPNVTFDGIVFDATGMSAGSGVENGFIWSTAAYTSVTACQFIGLSKGTCVWALGNAPYLSVVANSFTNCSGAVFAKGRHPVISTNRIVNATDAAIAVNGTTCVGGVVSGNTIANEALAAIPSMIAVEEGASDWAITGNTLRGANGGGIICTNVLDSTVVKGGVIADNIVNGRKFDGTLPSNSNPAALLSISTFYTDCIVHDNRLSGCPTGNSASRLAIIPATGTLFHDNVVDGIGTTGLAAMVEITAGSGGIVIGDNRTTGPTGARHFLFGGGGYGDTPCIFNGGCFYGGAEGINSELNAAGISHFYLYINNIADSSVNNIVNAASALGDRATWLNAGAWARPHRINTFTDMYGLALPTAGGLLPFQIGDRVRFLNPGATGFEMAARVSVAGVTSWKNLGPLPA